MDLELGPMKGIGARMRPLLFSLNAWSLKLAKDFLKIKMRSYLLKRVTKLLVYVQMGTTELYARLVCQVITNKVGSLASHVVKKQQISFVLL